MKTVHGDLSKATLAILAFLFTGTSFAASGEGEAAGQPAPPAKSGVVEATRGEVEKARKDFAGLGLSLLEKQEAYRGLVRLGYANEDIPIPDFLLRLNTIRAVKSYQTAIGAAATGYLSEGQIAVLRKVAGPPFPWQAGWTPAKVNDSGPAKPHPFKVWQMAGYTQAQKELLYRGLYNRGFVSESITSIDFTSDSLREAVKAYQAYNGAEPTGYLSKEQATELLADPGEPTAWESNEKLRKKVTGALSSPDGRARARAAWQKLQVSKEKKRALYRALYDLGFTRPPKPVADFAYRMEVTSAVEAFQSKNGFETTGFLNEEQIKILLDHESEPTPYELQEAVFDKYGERTVLNFLKDIGEQEYEGKYSRKLLISTLERKFSLPFQGYVTEELVEQLKTIPLKPKLGEVKPHWALLQPLEVSRVKDWRRWEIGESHTCETGTGAIEVEGFLGSARVPSVHFLRDQKWPLSSLDMEIELVNWDLDTVSTARIGGRNFYIAWDGARYKFTKRDGSELVSEGRVYTDFVTGLMRSNGFEVKYRTVFGNEVIASFSALGFSKQLRAIRKNCRK